MNAMQSAEPKHEKDKSRKQRTKHASLRLSVGTRDVLKAQCMPRHRLGTCLSAIAAMWTHETQRQWYGCMSSITAC